MTTTFPEDLIVRTKLLLPRRRQRTLGRPRVSARLQEAGQHRLTVVHAGTGYGKSTELATALSGLSEPLFWYNITETDADPLLFLLYLVHVFQARLPQVVARPARLLADGDVATAWRAAVDCLINELATALRGHAFLVLDDYHLVNAVPEVNAIVDHFVALLPPQLHLVIAARQPPNLPGLTQWRVKGEVLDVTHHDLAFDTAEIDALFRTQYGHALTPAQVQALAEETEGWAIALQLIAQGLQAAPGASVDQALAALPGSLDDLFAYLAHEVLARQPPAVQDFLLRTSVLRALEPAACDYLLDARDSETTLRRLEEAGLFVFALGDQYRYQHLFHDFLQSRAAHDPAAVTALHRRAATFYRARGDVEGAIYHLLAGGQPEVAADLMEAQRQEMSQSGRVRTLAAWAESLPAEVLTGRPALLSCLGDAARLNSRFDVALAWYEQARARYSARLDRIGVSQALQGQALVYLDTVRPLQAESLLQEALRLIDGQQDKLERARVLELLAENKLNRGQWAEAEALWRQARGLREEGPGEGDLDARVRLRTGRLAEAREMLERRAAAERAEGLGGRSPRSHRETLLVLSLIYAFQGEAERALGCAEEGIRIGQILASPFVEAVGYIRRGHALLLGQGAGAIGEAERSYRQAMALAESLHLPRLEVEVNWGLCRLYGFSGDVAAAERHGRRGMEVGLRAGDEWIAALTAVTLGASHALARQDEPALQWLGHAATAFRSCGDTFLRAVACQWLAWLHRERGEEELFARQASELLDLAGAHDYAFLLTRRTLLGLPDPEAVVPILLRAGHPYARALLAQRGLGELEHHPGYGLRIVTLGGFEVWRGGRAVGSREWQRQKARRLLQLLVTQRGQFLQREQILEWLWPEQDRAAEGLFKVALNALVRALEPGRPAQAAPFFVVRRGTSYGLNPLARIELDCERFQALIAAGRLAAEQGATAEASELLRQALDLYRGDYLPDALYESWCSQERERLHQLYLSAAGELARLLASAGAWSQVTEVCERILARDRCWEEAYRLLMTAYDRLGNRPAALRTYRRCVRCLREELETEPLPETVALYEGIRRR